MSLLFNWDARNGSYIEDVSKVAGAVTIGTGSFKRTEKGTAFYDKQSFINFGNLTAINTIGTGDFSIEFWVKKDGITQSVAGIIDKGSFTDVNDFALYFNVALLRVGIITAANFGTVLTSADIGVWRHFIVTRQGNVYTVYKDNVYLAQVTHAESLDWNNAKNVFVGARNGSATNNLDGFIGGIRIYNKALDVSERNRLYQSYLQSQITEKPIKHFELVKPTDLSYLKDRGLLLLAYNMKPNGSTLVDISGNAINGTIQSGCVVEKNQLFIPLTKLVTFSSITVPVSQNTICWRGKIKTIPGSYARILGGGGYLMFNPTLVSLLIRAASDSIVTFSTGLTTSNLNQDFDLVIARNGDVFKLYINGVLANTQTVTSTTALTLAELGNTSTTSGEINYEDFRIYNRELSVQEIKDYHNSFVKPVILEDWNSAVGDVI
jgi:hypothetical protein